MTELYWKAAAGVLVALILILTLGKQEKDLALLLGMLVCVMTGMTALRILDPVLEFLYRLQDLSRMSGPVLKALLKITGIGLVTELTGALCQDSGSAGLARGMQLLGAAVILSLSLPVFETLLDVIRQILGEL